MGISNFIGVIGCLFSLIVRLSLIFPLVNNRHKGEFNINSYSQTYFLLGIIQSVFYSGFGYLKRDFYILIASITGIIVFTAYLNIHIYLYGPCKHFVYFDLGILLLLFFSINAIPKDFNLYLAVAMACLWQSTGLSNIRLALMNKDISFVNILLSYCSFFYFLIWLIYSLIIKIYLLSLDCIVTIVFMFANIYIYNWAMGKISDEDPYILFLHNLLSSDIEEKVKEEEYDLSAKLKELNSDIFYRN